VRLGAVWDLGLDVRWVGCGVDLWRWGEFGSRGCIRLWIGIITVSGMYVVVGHFWMSRVVYLVKCDYSD